MVLFYSLHKPHNTKSPHPIFPPALNQKTILKLTTQPPYQIKLERDRKNPVFSLLSRSSLYPFPRERHNPTIKILSLSLFVIHSHLKKTTHGNYFDNLSFMKEIHPL